LADAAQKLKLSTFVM